MKVTTAVFAFAIVASSSLSVAALAPGTGLSGSVHDMTRYTSSGPSPCLYCHNGHSLAGTVRTARTGSGPDAAGDSGDPGRLCSTCHDGIVASYPLQHHRTGLPYRNEVKSGACGPKAAADAGAAVPCMLRDKDSFFAGTDVTIADRLWTSPSKGGAMIITCTTCHEVHNKGSRDESEGKNYLLISSKRNSALCFSCHVDEGEQTPERK
ncbi:hypothetical protein LPW11_13630 [Geomonas sp. RF6]|uniref:cytochrome c3 family protein n=1 Tax=Geomonas sp. RF6 TaxID=2897342 RepID=UPI001E5FD547|nr:cytochrome c3 family protein [Geomonas sp. RF6]UFS68935.1 hypothetical protein LPW11_13630 [Geomonas sp. RF6]